MFMQFEWQNGQSGTRLPIAHFEITNDSGRIKASSTEGEGADLPHDATYYCAVDHFLREGHIKAIIVTVEPEAKVGPDPQVGSVAVNRTFF